MNLEPGYHLVPDLVIAFIVSALSPWVAPRVLVCFIVPPLVSFIVLGPQNFGEIADDAGLIYLPYFHFVGVGILISAVGAFAGYLLRAALKLKT